ncbi:glycoside hydrolase [Paenibacillus sp. CC-CFT747]|nr:glycoside hydrolase [Paenibacillus sp. CC-CFT747]
MGGRHPLPTKSGKPHLLGIWQQDRWSNGGARGVVAAFSLDGGRTWRRRTLPFSQCAAPNVNLERASDPIVSIGPDGKAYASALSLSKSPNGTDVTQSTITAATSSDMGQTWKNLRVIQSDKGPWIVNDKELITADPTRAGTAYIVWNRGTATTVATIFSKTTDGGRSWSKPKVIFPPGEGNQTFGNQIIVDARTGTLYNFFNWTKGTASKNPENWITVQSSKDGGQTWSKGRIIAPFDSVAVVDPVTGKTIRGGGDMLPEAAIHQRTGELYVVWQSAKFSAGKYDEIALTRSTDGGITWSSPIRVNPPSGTAAFTPMVRINEAGVVGVTYYRIVNNRHSPKTLPVDYWFTCSTDHGHTFRPPLRITKPFNLLRAPEITSPFSPGLFIGDYQGLETSGNGFHLFFSKVNRPSAKDSVGVYATEVKVSQIRWPFRKRPVK